MAVTSAQEKRHPSLPGCDRTFLVSQLSCSGSSSATTSRASLPSRVGGEFPGWCCSRRLGYASVRVLNALLFDFVFRLRQGYEAPTLVRNIFTLVAFAILFFVVFTRIYTDVNLGALFTTSAIFGVIIGLALQDTLGNFFAGISLHADRPFQVGDVIVLGQQQLQA